MAAGGVGFDRSQHLSAERGLRVQKRWCVRNRFRLREKSKNIDLPVVGKGDPVDACPCADWRSHAPRCLGLRTADVGTSTWKLRGVVVGLLSEVPPVLDSGRTPVGPCWKLRGVVVAWHSR